MRWEKNKCERERKIEMKMRAAQKFRLMILHLMVTRLNSDKTEMEEMDENDSQRNEKRHNDAQTEERRKQQTMASMGGSPGLLVNGGESLQEIMGSKPDTGYWMDNFRIIC